MRLIDADKLEPDADYDDGDYWAYSLTQIQNAPTIEPELRWIPVKDKLPKPRINVWVSSDLGQMVAYYDDFVGTWYGRDYLELLVDAWMPLPEPYKKEDEN